MSQPSGEGTRAAVVYSSRFGSTEKVARALESGLRDSGLVTDCLSIEKTDPHSLARYRLLCLGAPTEAFSAHRPMKDFLASLTPEEVGGRLGFAFDTKIDWRLSGSAAKYIEHALEEKGVKKLAPRESAIVSTERTGGTFTGSSLRAGEEERFHEVGVRLGRAALSKTLT